MPRVFEFIKTGKHNYTASNVSIFGWTIMLETSSHLLILSGGDHATATEWLREVKTEP